MTDNGNNYSEGGYVKGSTDDGLIPAIIHDGYVISAKAIKKYTQHNLEVFMRQHRPDDDPH
jgi:hypothetical protein